MNNFKRVKSLMFAILLSLPSMAQSSHSFSPSNYSTVDKLSIVTIDFDEAEVADIYKSDDFGGIKWAVRNEKGDSVAGAYIYGYDCPTAILKIQPSIYTKGTYTVDLPEGYLWLYDASDNKTLAPAEKLTYTVSGKQSAPVLTPVFSPSTTEPLDYMNTISFKVNGYVAYSADINSNQKITVTDDNGAVVANGQAEGSYADSCGVIYLDKTIATEGTYTIHIPDNIFRIASDWNAYYGADYEMLPACNVTYNVKGSNVTLFEVSGGGTSAVPDIKLTFPQHKKVMLNGNKSFLCYTIYNEAGYYRSFTETWDTLITAKDNVLTLKMYSPLTSADTYKFSIPEGDLIFDDGSFNTPIAVTFTVAEPETTTVISSPADNSTVNEVYALDVTFKDASFVKDIYDYVSYAVTDSLGKEVTDDNGNKLVFDVDAIKGNTVSMRLSDGNDFTTLTKPGVYHVTLPKSYFFLKEDYTAVNSEIVLTLKVVKGEDTHTYTSWGYYDNDDISTLGAIGAGVETYHVAIFVPGDGMLHNAKLAGAKIPVRDAGVVTAIKAWMAPALKKTSTMTYIDTMAINSPHTGYNTVRFNKTYTVPAEGCYLGYTICVNNDSPLGAAYPVVYDDSTKIEHSLYMSIPGYDWYDYGSSYGVSALQGLFQDLDLSEASAYFGSIEGGTTQTSATSDWNFPITTTSESAISQIDYQIVVDGLSSTRTAIVNIPAGKKLQSTMTVSITAPEKTGSYDVKLTVLKINGKDNAVATTSVSTFSNVMRTVTRHTIVEEITGTGCGWCPRGLVGLQKLNRAYGDSVICLAFHRYNSNDPMWCNYAGTDELYLDGAPQCAIDRKTHADPYMGSQTTQNGIINEVANYLALPAAADITMKAGWTNIDCKEVQIEATLEAFTDDKYKLVYVLTADSLYADSQAWIQNNYYYEKAASDYPDDLALFCQGGEYGSSTFKWRYDDVVIGSSYDENGNNTSTDAWTMKAGTKQTGSFSVTIPQEGVIAEAIKSSIDKVYAVVFALDSKGQVAQAAKMKVSEVLPSGIEEIHQIYAPDQLACKTRNINHQPSSQTYSLTGQRITTPQKGQIVVSGGKKMVY